ncbi:hypothetical protein [Litoreibacter ponti]|nr:hypothetical protein [Litoreibacter ponti]
MTAALIAAYMLKDAGSLSLVPPGATEPDAVGREFWLHLSAYSAWVATVLLIPAYLFALSPDRVPDWRAFWTTSYLAYIIHLAISAFGFFGGDFAWMTNSSRVSAFWPGMVLALWWGLDVALSRRAGGWITVQRVGVHLMAFVLFFGGSAVMGELLTIRVIGAVLLGVALIAVIRWLSLRRAGAEAS